MTRRAILLGLFLSAFSFSQAPYITELKQRAEKGDAGAQFQLGYMYDFGQGVPQDLAEASRWYRKAADQGMATAQVSLGIMYSSGQGVPHDYTEAAKWYRKASDQGFAFAQFNLGVAYYQGQGVPQDFVTAHMWLNLAASKATGDEQKKFSQARDAVAAKMTPQQIAEAQRLAREWKPNAK